MLIDRSYFTKGYRQIHNATQGTVRPATPNSSEVNAVIDAYIEDLQRPFLASMLGRTVANKVETYLECVEDEEGYRKCERLDEIISRIRESFADYVFFHFLRDANERPYTTGLVRLKNANQPVAPIRRQVTAWNTMVDRNREFAEWMQTDEWTSRNVIMDNEMVTKINTLNL